MNRLEKILLPVWRQFGRKLGLSNDSLQQGHSERYSPTVEAKIEYWEPVLDVPIPKDNYQSTFVFGLMKDYDQGSIYLRGKNHHIRIDINNNYYRVFNRQWLNSGKYLNQVEVAKYQNHHFQEVIYEVKNSHLLSELREKGSGPYVYEGSQKHFIIITENLVFEMVEISGRLRIDMRSDSFERGNPWSIGKG